MTPRTARLAVDGGEPVRTRPFPPRRVFGPEERAAVDAFFARTIETGDDFRYGGDEQRAYEAEFARYHGGGHALLVSSGTAALYVVLGALEPRRPGEVVVPAVTDAGGVMPVPLLGLVPVVADTAPGSFNVGAPQIERCLSEWTRAIVVAHIGGEPVAMEPVLALARRHGLPVVEDCSQAHGAEYRGRPVGTFGDVAVYSTMTNKHHSTGGQGGVVHTRDPALYERIRRFSDRGKAAGADAVRNVQAALNFNGNDLAAVIGRVQLAKLPGVLAARRDLVTRLRAGLHGLEATGVPRVAADCSPAYWFVRIRLDLARLGVSMTEYLRALRAEGIPCGVWADIPAAEPWYERQVRAAEPGAWPLGAADRPRRPAGRASWPNAEAAAGRHVTLFVHERWTSREIDDACAALTKLERAYLARTASSKGARR
jgi:dTDP-4-amino-4,6-dideoxygalactose transaminase